LHVSAKRQFKYQILSTFKTDALFIIKTPALQANIHADHMAGVLIMNARVCK
jgi:hypothetical protein